MKDLGENACLAHTTGDTQQLMSRAKNLPVSLQVLFALAMLLGGMTMRIRMG